MKNNDILSRKVSMSYVTKMMKDFWNIIFEDKEVTNGVMLEAYYKLLEAIPEHDSYYYKAIPPIHWVVEDMGKYLLKYNIITQDEYDNRYKSSAVSVRVYNQFGLIVVESKLINGDVKQEKFYSELLEDVPKTHFDLQLAVPVEEYGELEQLPFENEYEEV